MLLFDQFQATSVPNPEGATVVLHGELTAAWGVVPQGKKTQPHVPARSRAAVRESYRPALLARHGDESHPTAALDSHPAHILVWRLRKIVQLAIERGHTLRAARVLYQLGLYSK